jgi:TolB-like protein
MTPQSHVQSQKSNGWIVLLLLAIAGFGAVGLTYFRARGNSVEVVAAIDSLAVLPFVNVAGNAETEQVSEDITNSLINTLSQLRDLRVAPRNAVSAYKGQPIDLQRVPRELNVRALLVGTVDLRGDKLLVEAELIDASAHSAIWRARYDRKLSDLVGIRSDIVRQISAKLRIE